MDQIRKRKIMITQWVKEISQQEENKTMILSDAQIEQLSRLTPTKIADFDAVAGIGEKFKNNYGYELLLLLESFNNQSISLQPSQQVNFVLAELEKKCINLSRRNKLLYVEKTSATFHDCYQLGYEPLIDCLFADKPLELINLKHNPNNVLYKQLSELFKRNEKSLKETGQHQLHIGYPFVYGQFTSDPFIIRAPLALFPVELVVKNNTISVKLNIDGDVLINTNLLVAAQKFLGFNKVLIPMELEDIFAQDFIQTLLHLYDQEGLSIEEPTNTFEPFTNISQTTPPIGTMQCQNQAVLGLFSIRDSALQRDYHTILNLNNYPAHVLTLLETINQQPSDDQIISPQPIHFKEADLIYINPLNASQQKAQLQIKKGNNLVIEGPPGTGKSQTISNVIAQAIADNKNVLMVSEKKAALEVVYSRLQKINDYAMIVDNLANKSAFYAQLDKIFENNPLENQIKLGSENHDLQTMVDDLTKIENLLLAQLTPQKTCSQLFAEVTYYDVFEPTVFESLKNYKACIPTELYAHYDEIKAIEEAKLNEELQRYIIQSQVSDLSQYKLNLSDFERISIANQLDNIENELNQFNSQSSLLRFFQKNRKKEILKDLYPLIEVTEFADLNEIRLILSNYTAFSNTHFTISSTILQTLLALSQYTPKPYATLVNVIGYTLIDNHLKNSETIKQLLNSYPTLHHDYQIVAKEKAEKTQTILYKQLQQIALKLKNNKRSLEMQRITNRKRKWSLAKFVNRFYVELFDSIKIWLCTPDVVSEIFPCQNGLFDLLIFDEASQIYVERAIGSIMRCKQMVIAGDSQQLRPSSFGVGRYTYDQEMEDEFIDATAALDEESLLDLARFKFPKLVLDYHYRCQFEELIAFSNATFYKNQLVIAPNATLTELPPIQVYKMENGRWQNRKNEVEADKVVALIEHILQTRNQNETIGVITFNITQKMLIESKLEAYALSNSAFNNLYQEEINRIENNEDRSLFIKNIENVQGDERDIIIFSIAYAYDDSGKIPSFYGWLSQSGGENRLNVAITRAKKQIYVVTSIEGHQLPLTETSAKGPLLLQQYLNYCYAISNKEFSKAQQICHLQYPLQLSNTKSIHPLCLRIEKDLKHLGYQCLFNYGMGDHVLEMVVLKQNELKLGLAFEHSLYQQKNQVYDRDIYLPAFYQSRGWKIHRVYDAQAFFNYFDEFNKIVAQLQ